MKVVSRRGSRKMDLTLVEELVWGTLVICCIHVEAMLFMSCFSGWQSMRGWQGLAISAQCRAPLRLNLLVWLGLPQSYTVTWDFSYWVLPPYPSLFTDVSLASSFEGFPCLLLLPIPPINLLTSNSFWVSVSCRTIQISVWWPQSNT